MPGDDRAADELAVGGDDVEVGAGAEVDDDRRAAVEIERRDRVGDAIGADLLRVVVEDRHAGLDAGLDHDGVEVEVAASPSGAGSRARAAHPSRSPRPVTSASMS